MLPQKFAILGIGVDKHKTNKAGKIDWTGISRHARADLDAFAALADLLAHEIAIQKSRLLEMIRTGDQLLWESKIFFPGSDKDEHLQVRQLDSLLRSIFRQIPDWDKDKITGLFRKTCTVNARAAGASSDAVNRHEGWKGDTQSRSYAVASLEAYIDTHAVLAGYKSQGWRDSHHLLRSTVDVESSWCNALLPGLSEMPSDLSLRRTEVLQCIQKIAEAYWQALPINVLKYGQDFVRGLPGILEVMQMPEYEVFSNRVRQAEYDSMHMLQCMDKVPHLVQWKLSHDSVAISDASVLSDCSTTPAEATASFEPQKKRQKCLDTGTQAAASTPLEEKQREMAAFKEAREIQALDLQLQREQAVWAAEQAAEQAEAKRAIAVAEQRRRAAEAPLPSSMALSYMAVPTALETLSASPMSSVEAPQLNARTPARQSSVKAKVKLFRGQNVTAAWNEWQYGGDSASVKSRLLKGKNGWTLRGTNAYVHSVTKEF